MKGDVMGRVTVFCVQPYWYDGRRLARGLPEQYRTEAEARRAAERLYDNHAGVSLLAISGEPEFEVWSEPTILVRYGRTPASSPA